MHTLGYRFRPWTDSKTIADGPVDPRVRARDRARGGDRPARSASGHRVVGGRVVERGGALDAWRPSVPTRGRRSIVTCGFLFVCSGYYRYDEGYTPEFEGIESFGGQIVHPQHWPEDLDYAGKRVVVIGSGATAVTLVPAMAEEAAHVTMLQRSPTYIVSLPAEDPIAEALRRVLPDKAVYAIVRWKNVLLQTAFYQLSRRRPQARKEDDPPRRRTRAAGRLRRRQALQAALRPLGPAHVPGARRRPLQGDLATAAPRSSPTRSRPSPRGGSSSSPDEELEADVDHHRHRPQPPLPRRHASSVVDGDAVDVPKTMTYKGMMLSGVPNFAFTVGYTNASWTLKADLTSEYVCRLLAHMDAHGYTKSVPEITDPSVTEDAAARFHLRLRPALAATNFPSRARRSPGSCVRTTSSICARSGAARSTMARCSSPKRRRACSRPARRSLAELTELTDQQAELCESSETDYSDLSALFINCTLKRSPERVATPRA